MKTQATLELFWHQVYQVSRSLFNAEDVRTPCYNIALFSIKISKNKWFKSFYGISKTTNFIFKQKTKFNR